MSWPWCAGLADCQKSKWEPEPATFKGAVVHHTAGNNTYTQGQVPQQIRNLWSWQADGLGWDDVGYNLIVDKFGGIWVFERHREHHYPFRTQ